MKQFKYKKIDAFATSNSDGNPAGYIWLENNQSLSEDEMLRIAKQQKGFVNEVGFVKRTSEDIFHLRYFSSEREVDFCGHATIAIMYDLVKTKADILPKQQFFIQTNRGLLTVYNRVQKENAVFIVSLVPVFINQIPNIELISVKLRISQSEIQSKMPISIINSGLNTLIVPINSLQSILSIIPDLEELKAFCITSGIDIILVYTSDVATTNNDFRTRVFAPTFGYLEDPATGSGNSAFGYYLLQLSLWKKETIMIEQNNDKERFNIVKLQTEIDENGIERVLFGGGAITRIEGNYFLQ